ncbi:Tripartite motif-containing protein 2 [Oopsacas minuta]|uniref:Tripartite motif-containing protein 2 n=1 Tax=Oopsacas minuta TaxID=111878 RepID=A0AAV7KII7_9METZ|nr:Tripartite motif-containing protein 2 [Oopsacas minuta]
MAEQIEEDKSNLPLGFKREIEEIRKSIETNFFRLINSIQILRNKLLAHLSEIEDLYDREQRERLEALDSLKKAAIDLESNLAANSLRDVLDNSLALFETEKEVILTKNNIEKNAVCIWNWELERNLENICSLHLESVGNTQVQETQVVDVGVQFEDNTHADKSFHNKYVNSTANKGNGLGEMNCPSNIAVSKQGVMYVTDSHNDRVCVYLPNLEFLFHFGDKIAFGKMSCPKGIAISNDILFVSNSGSNSISSYNLNGEFVRRIGTKGTKYGEFNHPEGLVFDEESCLLFVCDRDNNRVQAFDRKLEFKKEIYRNELVNPLSIRARDSTVIILDEGATCLHFVNSSNYERIKDIITRGPEGQVLYPTSFEVSSEEFIYVSDSSNDCSIAVFNMEGLKLSSIRNEGKLELLHPMGLAWTQEEHLLCLCWRDKQQLIELS